MLSYFAFGLIDEIQILDPAEFSLIIEYFIEEVPFPY